jgi:hypothetical protein
VLDHLLAFLTRMPYSILFHFIPFYSILFHFIPFYSILFLSATLQMQSWEGLEAMWEHDD